MHCNTKFCVEERDYIDFNHSLMMMITTTTMAMSMAKMLIIKYAKLHSS